MGKLVKLKARLQSLQRQKLIHDEKKSEKEKIKAVSKYGQKNLDGAKYRNVHIYDDIHVCDDEDESKRKIKVDIPYSNRSVILLVGEGNFSFTKSIIENYGIQGAQIISTSYDSEDQVYEKYDDAKEIIEYCQEKECVLLHAIDASKLSSYSIIKKKPFISRIVFNFPHVGLGIKNRERNIIANQKLLDAFFRESAKLLEKALEHYSKNQIKHVTFRTSKTKADKALNYKVHEFNVPNVEETPQIHVTLKTGDPYDDWNIKKLAKNQNLVCIESFEFYPDNFPGYEHRRTLGYTESSSENNELKNKLCKTFVFILNKE